MRRRTTLISAALVAIAAFAAAVAQGTQGPAMSYRAYMAEVAKDGGVAAATPLPGGDGLPALPPGWPAALHLGVSSSPGTADDVVATAPFAFRYQYLAGGANTGGGWATWNPNGAFVTSYLDESQQHGLRTVFTYYMLRQSSPGNGMAEVDGVRANLENSATMRAWFEDLRLFFQRAAGLPAGSVVLHVEPDLWGYLQQRAGNDDPASAPVRVGATGMAELAGLPDNAAGLAQGVKRLRDQYAPAVLIAYHLSGWATGEDPVYSDPSNDHMRELAQRSAQFYLRLGAPFDLAFSEFSDRDAGFKQHIYGDGGASWWDSGDFARNVVLLGEFSREAGVRLAMWQIPQGNTRMRAMNNTWNHFQDNRVEWLLDDTTGTHLAAYTGAGVVAFLFGRGADGATCACDANGDGITNPAPINGNSIMSYSADDDGGYFARKAKDYYAAGPPSLP